ncbi:MAG TPA: hypothetical protein VE844_04965 [Gammaproteobacteria bacterium]|nr:hypothetical protein [Gammaproteobacteria bacterium]
MVRHFNRTLVAWAMRKYRRLKGHKTVRVYSSKESHPDNRVYSCTGSAG